MADQMPIPIPWRQRWREFRVSHLPLLMFMTLLLGIGILWSRYVHPANIIGEVESLRFPIVSTTAGTVQSMQVALLQRVTNGQVLAVVTIADPQSIQAQLNAVEADLRLLQARMAFDHAQEADSHRRLRLDLMTERINLGLAQIRLRQAEGEFERVEDLFERNLVPKGLNLASDGNDGRFEYGYDVALRDRDALRTEVQERQRLVTNLEGELAQSRPEGTAPSLTDTSDVAIENAIRAQRLVLEQTLKPVILRASLDGFVSGICNRPGDLVVAGAPLLTISAHSNDQIIAWVRPPVIERPKIGDRVLVRRMDVGRVSTTGTVIEVGGQLEPLRPSLQSPGGNAARVEVGLPILVRLTDPGDLIPGEPVQVELTSTGRRVAN
jgi:multidrug resistance efflux pump